MSQLIGIVGREVYQIFVLNLVVVRALADLKIKKDSNENHAVFFKACLQRQQDLCYSVGSGSLLIFLQ